MNSDETSRTYQHKTLDTLIVGCGRSGTSFLSHALSASGFDCAHEAHFDAYGININCSNRVESSWYAVPYLDILDEHVKIIHVVRDPKKVIDSFYNLGLFSDKIWRHLTMGKPIRFASRIVSSPTESMKRLSLTIAHRKFLERNTTVFGLTNELERVEQYWVEWNEKILHFLQRHKNPSYILDIDKFQDTKADLAAFLDVKQINAPNTGRNLKTIYKTRKLKKYELSDKTKSLAVKLGI